MDIIKENNTSNNSSINDLYLKAPISKTAIHDRHWNLEGRIEFVGKPCPPGHLTVPPCNGPYPNYHVKIYLSITNTIVFETKTDSNGNFKAFLEPGNYIIYTRAGLYPTDLKSNYFTIEKDKIKKLNTLFVDTGLE
jgi:hypothetical protein